MRRLTAIALSFVMMFLFTTDVNAKWEKEIGKTLIKDAFFPMPAGPGKVAFFRADEKIPGQPVEMFLADLESGEITRPLPGYNFRDMPSYTAAWSPDGSEFITPKKVDDNWELFLYKLGSYEGEKITDLVKYRVEVTKEERDALGISPSQQLSFGEMSYSPSGKRLIFSLLRLAKTSLWWHNLETGKSRQATEDRVGAFGSFHPDDDQFCYTAFVTKEGITADEDILVRSLTTGTIDTVCHTRNHERQGTISPDGKYLAYVKKENNINNIHVINLATKKSQQITFAADGQNCTRVNWSVNGKKLFFQGSGIYSKPAVFEKEFIPF